MDLRFDNRRAKSNVKLGEVVELSLGKTKKMWSSRFLSVITIILVMVATTAPALAQFTPPTQPVGIPCLGFFCNIAQKATGNALFTPMSSVVNGLFTLVNFAVGGLYMIRGYGIVRKIDRNQEEWKQDAVNVATSLGAIFLVYIISLSFLS